MKLALAVASLLTVASGVCPAQGGFFDINPGDDSARTPVTGAAGGAESQNANNQLERCDQTMGTLAVVEDQQARWYWQLRNEYNLQSTVPLVRLLIQQSNCFVVVERGRAMQNMMQERALEQSGEMRQGSNFGKGQLVAADYTMNPMITFSSRDSGGMGGALGGIAHGLFGSAGAVFGAVAGSLKFKEASTTLTLVDNRSGVQLAAAEGAASKTDFGAWGGVFGGSGGGGLGGYTNTPEGKVIAGAFADAYNQMVKAVKNYRAQSVEGGLGTGGTLGVQGGQTPASRGMQ
ncbi:MAG: CsgG/HfaB family protein [Betaproteobacteria bacterium]|nr:CsgG/HfaB family protein [Betaproteobacteria bacterium]